MVQNLKIIQLCEREGITYINGVPYNPHVQGTVEIFHYTIKKYLGKEFINNVCKKLDFDEVRLRVINFYNNKVYRMLGITPFEAPKLTDIDEINKINEIKNNKINNKRTYLQDNDTCILNPKLILVGKNTLFLILLKKEKLKKKFLLEYLKNLLLVIM